ASSTAAEKVCPPTTRTASSALQQLTLAPAASNIAFKSSAMRGSSSTMRMVAPVRSALAFKSPPTAMVRDGNRELYRKCRRKVRQPGQSILPQDAQQLCDAQHRA